MFNILNDKPLVVVDIQPTYMGSIEGVIDLSSFVNAMNTIETQIYYIFVGEDLECDDIHEVQWMLHRLGVEERCIEQMIFIEKDYGWIREEMDCGDEDDIERKLKSGEADYAIDILNELPDDMNICGGGRNECLAEVKHTLDFMGKTYNEVETFIY